MFCIKEGRMIGVRNRTKTYITKCRAFQLHVVVKHVEKLDGVWCLCICVCGVCMCTVFVCVCGVCVVWCVCSVCVCLCVWCVCVVCV